jgi:hypothetical protein
LVHWSSLFKVKTQIQAHSHPSVAVGYQVAVSHFLSRAFFFLLFLVIIVIVLVLVIVLVIVIIIIIIIPAPIHERHICLWVSCQDTWASEPLAGLGGVCRHHRGWFRGPAQQLLPGVCVT